MRFEVQAGTKDNPERLAAAYLMKYFGNRKIEYPINPFRMLKLDADYFKSAAWGAGQCEEKRRLRQHTANDAFFMIYTCFFCNYVVL